MDEPLTVLRQAVRVSAAEYQRIALFCAAVLPLKKPVNLWQQIESYHEVATNYGRSLKALLTQISAEPHTPEVVSEMNQIIREGLQLTSETLKMAK